MPTKLGLISDPHATPAPVAEALSIFRDRGVAQILCAGDIAGYGDELEQTIDLLNKHDCLAIAGNHDYWHLEKNTNPKPTLADLYLKDLPPVLEIDIEDKSLYVVHASPPMDITQGIKLLDQFGEQLSEEHTYWSQQLSDFSYDILVVGHTHQVFAEWLGDTLVINPGSTKFNHTCAILTIPELEVEWFSLSGLQPQASWNWGKAVRESLNKS